MKSCCTYTDFPWENKASIILHKLPPDASGERVPGGQQKGWRRGRRRHPLHSSLPPSATKAETDPFPEGQSHTGNFLVKGAAH